MIKSVKGSVLIFGVLLSILFATSCTSNTGDFALVNKANETIARASVEISGQKFEFMDVEPNETVLSSYEVRFDSHYTIEIEFQTGRLLQKETGYVTSGMDFQHEITVTSSNIELTDIKVK